MTGPKRFSLVASAIFRLCQVGQRTSNVPEAAPLPGNVVAASRTDLDCLIILPGDVNIDGQWTVADLITMVNFVFKAGAPLQPCLATGAVNCSGAVTSADVINMVHTVFLNTWHPCDICASSPLAATCM